MNHRTIDQPARLAITMIALLLASAVLAQAHDAHGTRSMAITGSDYAFAGPETVPAGMTSVTFTNDGAEPHHVQIARLNDGVTPEDALQALQQGPGPAMALVELVGGVGVILPGESQTVIVDLTRPGTYIELCLVDDANGVPHFALGMTRFFEVKESDADAARPDIQVDLVVRMVDFGYVIPAEVRAGPQTWEVVNDGPQPHELALLKILDGYAFDDVMAYFQNGGEGGPPPAIPVGGAQAMANGRSNFVELDLTPGQYIALCFVPDPATGQSHLALGMVTTFVVGN
jgi:hypothetical protein